MLSGAGCGGDGGGGVAVGCIEKVVQSSLSREMLHLYVYISGSVNVCVCMYVCVD